MFLQWFARHFDALERDENYGDCRYAVSLYIQLTDDLTSCLATAHSTCWDVTRNTRTTCCTFRSWKTPSKRTYSVAHKVQFNLSATATFEKKKVAVVKRFKQETMHGLFAKKVALSIGFDLTSRPCYNWQFLLRHSVSQFSSDTGKWKIVRYFNTSEKSLERNRIMF